MPTSHLHHHHHHPHPHSQSQTPAEQDTLRQTSYFLSLRERARDTTEASASAFFPFKERCDQHDQLVDPDSFSRSMLGCLYLFISALSFITATGHFHLSRQSNRTGIRAHTWGSSQHCPEDVYHCSAAEICVACACRGIGSLGSCPRVIPGELRWLFALCCDRHADRGRRIGHM